MTLLWIERHVELSSIAELGGVSTLAVFANTRAARQLSQLTAFNIDSDGCRHNQQNHHAMSSQP